MASSLFSNQQPQTNQALSQAQSVAKMLSGKSPMGALQFMFNMNPNMKPQFEKFINDNQGKSLDQIAKENGIDPAIIHRFIG